MIRYLTQEKIEELNFLALTLIKAKKSDSAKILSKAKLNEIVENCKNTKGDIFDKATVLLVEIIKKHAFASGNRRTAFIAMKYFLKLNGGKTKILDNPKNAKPMQGIRENYYSHNEIKEWIKNGSIREFKR